MSAVEPPVMRQATRGKTRYSVKDVSVEDPQSATRALWFAFSGKASKIWARADKTDRHRNDELEALDSVKSSFSNTKCVPCPPDPVSSPQI